MWIGVERSPPERATPWFQQYEAAEVAVQRALLIWPPRACPAVDHTGSALPGAAAVGQLGAAAHGQAARARGARRVLGLLPHQLAAHAALPEGLARALRGRRAAGDRRPHRRLPPVAR